MPRPYLSLAMRNLIDLIVYSVLEAQLVTWKTCFSTEPTVQRTWVNAAHYRSGDMWLCCREQTDWCLQAGSHWTIDPQSTDQQRPRPPPILWRLSVNVCSWEYILFFQQSQIMIFTIINLIQNYILNYGNELIDFSYLDSARTFLKPLLNMPSISVN